MSFDFYLDPDEIREQADEQIAKLKADNELLEREMTYLNTFGFDILLTGRAFNALRQKAGDVRLTKSAKQVANESLIADYNLLKEYVGDELLDGAAIEMGLAGAQAARSNMRTTRRRLRIIRNLGGFSNPSIWFNQNINNTISSLSDRIAEQDEIIANYERKRDTYWEIVNVTSNLFTNDRELRAQISSGVSHILQAARGLPSSYSSPALDQWRTDTFNERDRVREETDLTNRTVNVLRLLRGCPDAIAMVGDPVNSATGNFIYPTTDLMINGRFPLAFKRFYNSRSDYIGSLGKGWTHNWDIHLIEQIDENNERLINIQFGEDGHQEHFVTNEDGTYVTPKGKFSKLEKTEAGQYILTYPDKSSYLFSELGLVQIFKDKNGYETKFEYEIKSETEEGILTEVSTLSGHLVFDYTENNKLASVTDHAGRTLEFGYDEEGQSLVSFTNVSGNETKYDYDIGNRLEKITNERGHVVLENTFDGHDRATKQVFPDHSIMEYTYDKDSEKTTEFTERNKSKTRYKHDDEYRTTEIIHPGGGKEEFKYNDNNQREEHYNQDQVSQMHVKYDDHGNMLSFTNALGIATEFEYTEDNQVSKVKVDGKETLMKSYDQDGNLLEVKDALNNKILFEYIAKGVPQTIIKPDGSKVTLVYDERKNVTQMDMAGIVVQYQYDDLNRPIVSIDGNGNETHYQYDDADNIIAVKNAEGNTQEYEYNESNKVTSITDFGGGVVKREYNKLNKPSKLIDQLGRETKLDYDMMWNVSCVTQPNGAITSYMYNERNQLRAVRQADGGKVEYHYDTRGNRIAVIDELGDRTSFVYDDLGQLLSVKSEGVDVSCEYNVEGRITSIREDGELTVNLIYNEIGQLICEQNVVGDSRRYTYTSLGKIATRTDEANRVTTYDYELGGRLKSITYPDGREDAWTYDSNGNIKTVTQKDGENLTYDYDCLNRIINIVSSVGGTKSYSYDALGNVTNMIDELGNTTNYEYTPTGQLSKVIDALGNIAIYTYDEMDQIMEIRQLGKDHVSLDTDLKNAIELNEENEFHITRYEHNKMGQLTAITDAYGHKENYKYDLKGQLIEKIDKEGYLTKYAYTPTGDVNHIQYDDGKEVKMKYNSLRQLTEIEDCLGVTKISLDKLGRTIEVADHNNKVVAYDWGKFGEKRKITYPNGTVVNYDYDELLRLKEVNDGTSKTSYLYDQQSRLTEKLYQNGLKTTYAYNSVGKIAEIAHLNKDSLLDKFEYDYDLAGNKIAIKKYRSDLPEDTGVFTYSYDPLNRLQDVIKDGENLRSYAYDEYANRIKKVAQGNEITYSYNALNQLISTIDTTNDTKQFTYDKRGNIIETYNNEALVNQYVFSSLNRLEKAINHDTGKQSIYRYNGLGHRVGRAIGTSNLEPTKHIDDVLDMTKSYHNLLERDGTSYVWDTNLLSVIHNDMTQDYLLDSAGSPVRIGEDVLAYDEFGNSLTELTNGQLFGFTGYQYDGVANTWYAQAREYDSMTGRFVSEDAVKGYAQAPISQNLYTYCFNMPLNFVDLDGNWGEEEHYKITNIAAQLLGFPDGGDFVQTINGHNKSVDSVWEWPSNNSAPIPGIGDMSMHFDHSWWWQQDSRLTHSEDYLNRAIAAFPHDQDLALLYLGRGSHPLQDIHAHGQLGRSGIVPPGGVLFALSPATWLYGNRGHAAHSLLPNGLLLGNPDRFNYDWADDRQRSFRRIPYELRYNEDGERYLAPALRFNQRFIDAVLDTEDYLRYFMEATGFPIKDSLY